MVRSLRGRQHARGRPDTWIAADPVPLRFTATDTEVRAAAQYDLGYGEDNSIDVVHRREIEKLRGRLTNRGMALVPLQVYFKNGVAKVQLGLGRGRKKGDERESIKRQEDLKEARAAMQRQKG